MNYGLVFTAWGIGGFALALLAGRLYDTYQTFTISCYVAATLLVIAALAARFVHPPQRRVAPAVAPPPAPESRPATPPRRMPVGV